MPCTFITHCFVCWCKWQVDLATSCLFKIQRYLRLQFDYKGLTLKQWSHYTHLAQGGSFKSHNLCLAFITQSPSNNRQLNQEKDSSTEFILLLRWLRLSRRHRSSVLDLRFFWSNLVCNLYLARTGFSQLSACKGPHSSVQIAGGFSKNTRSDFFLT